MKVLVTGSGGREHALAWRAAQSPGVEQVFVAPGNAGTAAEAKIQNVDLDVMDFESQIRFATEHKIDLTIIGPEAPLVEGVVDRFTEAGLRCLGPVQGAAQLEGSKSFTKAFMQRHGIPTADYRSFDEMDEALAYAASRTPPIVIKADGLAAGKGVVVAASHDEAFAAIGDMMADSVYGAAGARVVIEDFLVGEEASFIVIADGQSAVPFASSQDHKAAFDGDMGPNTGGMGAYSPAPVVTSAVHKKIMDQVIMPVIRGMAAEGYPYKGFLYAGLMIDGAGEPSVIEFNCRFGDPETQPVMMRMRSDLVALCQSAIDGKLGDQKIEFDPRPALTVVMAAGGYPGTYSKGDEITDQGQDSATAHVFHAGTTIQDGKVVTNGGRVLGVTALGNSVLEAQTAAYQRLSAITYREPHFRNDIGYRAVAREQS